MDFGISKLLAQMIDFSNSGGVFDFPGFYNFISNLFSSGTFETIKLISFILSGVFVLLLIFINVRIAKVAPVKAELLTEITPPEPAGPDAIGAKWGEIQRHVDSTKEAEWKMAVIEADKLMEDVLKKAGFPGETMGERLMAIQQGQLQSLDYIWEAHKIRNRLAHDTNYFLRQAEAQRAVKLFSRALEELQVL